MAQIEEAELTSAGLRGTVNDGRQRTVSAALLRKLLPRAQGPDRPARPTADATRSSPAAWTSPAWWSRFPLRFDGCEFDSAPVVEGADLFELALTGCPRLPGLLGNGLRLRRDLDLSGSRVAGAHRTSASTSKSAAVWLCESEIGGRLLCVGTTLDGQGGRSIQADRIRVGGGVRLIHRFHGGRGQADGCPLRRIA